jgi:hypothetical protein
MFNDLFSPKGRVALVSARSPQHRQDDRGRILSHAGASTAPTLRHSNECDLS